MKHKDDIQEELRNISPFLDKKLSKKQGYRVPKNYFKQLPDELMKQAVYMQPGLAETSEPKPSQSWLERLIAAPLQYKTLAGLGLVALVFMVNFFYNPTNQDPYSGLSSLTANEVSDYLDENISDFKWEDLVEADIVSNQDFDFDNIDQIDSEAIDNYLEEAELELDEALEEGSYFSI